MSPPHGANFTNSIQVTLGLGSGDLALGAQIHFTTDNSAPSLSSPLYHWPSHAHQHRRSAKPGPSPPTPSPARSLLATFFTGSSIGLGTRLERGLLTPTNSMTFNNPPSLVRLDPFVNFNWNKRLPRPRTSLKPISP